MNHRPKEQADDILKEVLTKFYLVDNELYKYGEPRHHMRKCRFNRYVGFKVNHHMNSVAHMLTDRIIFILQNNRIPEMLKRNDSNKLVEITASMHGIYRSKYKTLVKPHIKGHIARITTLEGKHLVRIFKEAHEAHTFICNEREKYRPTLTRLDLLSYYEG